MRQHFVEFFCPGTFFAERARKPIDKPSINLALEMAKSIEERYKALPYGFVFIECIISPRIPDGEDGWLDVNPKEVSQTGMHFFGKNKLMKYDEVPEDKYHEILRSNMRCNHWPYVVENTNSWKCVQPFEEKDCIVGQSGHVLINGNDQHIMEYRQNKIIDWKLKNDEA